MRVCLVVFLLLAAPASADRYTGPAPDLDGETIAQCLLERFFKGFGKTVPARFFPEQATCQTALYPCHARYDVAIASDLDLGTLPAGPRHQFRHCLFQHLEEAEWLGFQGLQAEIAAQPAAETRQIARNWQRDLRRGYGDCAAGRSSSDINTVACYLNVAIGMAADREAAQALQARITDWQSK